MKRMITQTQIEDAFLDEIFASKLPRNKLKLKIKNHTRPVIITLAQLYIYHRDVNNHKHWSHEVIINFPEIDRFDGKGRGKLPSEKFIFEHSWGEYKHNIKKLMAMAVIHEGKNQFYDEERAKNVKEFTRIARDYIAWLSKELSQDDVLDPDAAISKLQELGLL